MVNSILILIIAMLLLFFFFSTGCQSAYGNIGEDLRQKWSDILNAPSTPENEIVKKQLYEEIVERFERAEKHKFEISGSIVDADSGDKLSQVRIAYSFYSISGWDPQKRTSGKKSEIVDGSFGISGGGVAITQCHFL
jgi:hypothetical protein